MQRISITRIKSWFISSFSFRSLQCQRQPFFLQVLYQKKCVVLPASDALRGLISVYFFLFDSRIVGSDVLRLGAILIIPLLIEFDLFLLGGGDLDDFDCLFNGSIPLFVFLPALGSGSERFFLIDCGFLTGSDNLLCFESTLLIGLGFLINVAGKSWLLELCDIHYLCTFFEDWILN